MFVIMVIIIETILKQSLNNINRELIFWHFKVCMKMPIRFKVLL